jgi:hypothetical protein
MQSETNNILKTILQHGDSHQNTTKHLIHEILKHIIAKDKKSLDLYCNVGLPDEFPLIRSLVWKINLKYLNLNHCEYWEEYLTRKRQEYNDIKEAFQLRLEAERVLYKDYFNMLDNKEKNGELLLIIQNTDKQLLEDIHNDIKRTHTHMNFFFMPCNKERRDTLTNEDIEEIVKTHRGSRELKVLNEIYKSRDSTHSDVLCRILYIYAKLNPDLGYVQGMNEILAPIYYTFSFDEQMDSPTDIEADTYWAFSFLMEDIKPMFMRSSDNTSEGIFSKLQRLTECLKIIDKDIYNHLQKTGVDLNLVAFRWFVLMFTQELILPDILRVWDMILVEKDRFLNLYFIALAFITLKKVEILKGDFTGIIMKMQELDCDIETVLEQVGRLKKAYEKKVRKIIYK